MRINRSGSFAASRMSCKRNAHVRQPDRPAVGFITTSEWHDIVWEIGLDRRRVIVDGEVRFEGAGQYAGIESAPSVGQCFGSTVSVREFTITPLP
jgi:hypothetical protein